MKKWSVTGISIVLSLIFLATFFIGCVDESDKNTFVGTWEYKDPSNGDIVTLKFNDEEAGTLSIGQEQSNREYKEGYKTGWRTYPNDIGGYHERSFFWKIENGKFYMLLKENRNEHIHSYTFKDSDTVKFTPPLEYGGGGGAGSSGVMTRK